MSGGLAPLIEVSEHVRREARSRRVAVIFDLDSTLFCVSTRTRAILRRLAAEPEFAARFSREAEILRDVEVLPTDWGVRAALERAAVTPSRELFLAVRDYWRRHFFSSGFLDHDVLYPSAAEYVRHLHGLGARLIYLTGRGDAPMREGTERTLRAGGFPFGGDVRLLMKPTDVLTDESFKAEVLADLAHEFDHLWFFENEPVIIEQVRARLPQVHVIFVDSVHSGRAAAPADLRTIRPDYSGEWE